jgi:O-antigen/teichoic acid export membrane protein
VHVIVALVLIPRYGAPAVGLARDLSMGTFFVLNSVYVERRVLAAHPWRLVWRPVVATGSMAFFVFVGVPGWPFWARGAAGLALYGVILGLLTAIRMREDRRIVPKSPGSSVAEGPPDEDQP